MSPQTEAECLLETGALYRSRVGLRTETGDPAFAGFKDGAFSLYYGDAPIYHFDLEGRWQRAFVEGVHYLKALDTTVQAIDRVREGRNLVLKRRTLGFAETSELDARVRSAVLELLSDIGHKRLGLVAPPPNCRRIETDELAAFLERIVGWDAAAWFAHRERYVATYGPLPFLPPDCPAAIVLQATLGHEDGVAFGGAPAAEHAVRTPGEFAQHAREVRQLYGERVAQSRALFLGGGDVLRRPQADLLAFLATISEVFPARGAVNGGKDPLADGVHSFLDRPTGPLPDREQWRMLAQTGLRRVSVGVESGAAEVRALYRRHWADDVLRSVVADLKAAGLGVGVLTLAGAGGVEWAERHPTATAELLRSLPLGAGDLVSLLDAEEVRAGAGGFDFTPMSAPAREEQLAGLKAALAPLRERGAKVMPYRLEKQGL